MSDYISCKDVVWVSQTVRWRDTNGGSLSMLHSHTALSGDIVSPWPSTIPNCHRITSQVENTQIRSTHRRWIWWGLAWLESPVRGNSAPMIRYVTSDAKSTNIACEYVNVFHCYSLVWNWWLKVRRLSMNIAIQEALNEEYGYSPIFKIPLVYTPPPEKLYVSECTLQLKISSKKSQ